MNSILSKEVEFFNARSGIQGNVEDAEMRRFDSNSREELKSIDSQILNTFKKGDSSELRNLLSGEG